MFRYPKCKAEGMTVDCRPSVRTEFDGEGDVIDHEFQEGPGAYDDDDTAFCGDCSFIGKPDDFEYEEEDEQEDDNEEEEGVLPTKNTPKM